MDNPTAPIPSVPPQPAVPSPAKTADHRWLLWSAIGLTFLVIGIAIGVFSAKFLNQSQGQLQQNQPISAPTPLPAEASAQAGDPIADWKTYTDPDQSYSFRYPNIWTILSQTPKEFQAAKSYVEGETLENWLNGKMMASRCRGPIMQNLEHHELLIVFEVVPANSDGKFCWSLGHFMEDNKWKVADSYMYPPGNGTLQTPTWKGDYFLMREVMKNANLRVFAAFINRETYSFQGKDEFDQILSTFKFLDQN